MTLRRLAPAVAALLLGVPAAALAADGATIEKKSSAPRLAVKIDVVLRTNDPNALADKLGYELKGLFGMFMLGGLSTDLPQRESPFGDLGPSVVTADELASLLVGLWDRSNDPTLAEAVNGFGGVLAKGHKGVTATLNEQLGGMMKMLGLAPATAVPAKEGADPNAFMMPGWQLYADGEETGEGEELTPPPLVSINEDGSDTVHNGDGSTTNGPPGDPGDWEGPGGKPDEEKAPSAEKVRDAIIDAVKSVKSAAETYTSMPVYIGVTIKGGQEQGTPTMGGLTINFNLPPYKYTDPDAAPDVKLSPEEIQQRLTNELKDGLRPEDVQEPPPGADHPYGDDPTLELHDPDSTAGTLAPVSDPGQVHATAPIDFHPDGAPPAPGTDQPAPGDEPPHGEG